MARTSQIRDRLITYLLDTLRRNREHGVSIPTVRSMAAVNDVAYETMWKAVNQLRLAGAITVAPRRGVRAAQRKADPSPDIICASDDSSVPLPGKKWLAIRASIGRAIAQGEFAHSLRLPAAKNLCVRFGASHPVLRRALLKLCEDGELEVCRGGYRVARGGGQPGGDAILLVTGALREGDQFGRAFTRNWDLLRAMESVCVEAGLRLEQIARPEGYRHYRSPAQVERIRGFIVWTQGLEHLDVNSMVADLAGTGRPLVVLDEKGTVASHEFGTPTSLVRLFTLGQSQEAGRVVGRYLRHLGHRRIACFFPPRLKARLLGLQQAFAHNQATEAVRVFEFDSDTLYSDTSPLRVDDVLVSRAPTAHLAPMLQQVRSELQPHVAVAITAARHYDALEASFAAALRDARVTAWVGGNDLTALQCLRFLRAHDVDVPGRLSLVGFDDTVEAVLHDLTSYNFNIAGLAHAMVHHIVRPQMGRERQDTVAAIEVRGHLIVRATSGWPDRQAVAVPADSRRSPSAAP